MSECMTQEDAERMDASQAVSILKSLRAMMIDRYGCPISATYFALGKAIEALEQPTVAASPWRRVEEELPDDSREVIIVTTSMIVGVGSFIRPNWFQWYSGGGLPVDVTHWMPLPEPPKEDV